MVPNDRRVTVTLRYPPGAEGKVRLTRPYKGVIPPESSSPDSM